MVKVQILHRDKKDNDLKLQKILFKVHIFCTSCECRLLLACTY
jgi:hypothetical protein